MRLGRFLLGNARFLTAGALLSFGSSFGQTYFISVFAGVLMADLGLSDGDWGGIYALGTMASAALMVWAGTLVDRFRVRQLAWIVVPCLALSCLAMAVVPAGWALIPVVFLLRFFGQGMMAHLSVTAMARWFVAARGKALSISALGFALGQALLPLVVVLLMALVGWRWVWVIAALSLMAALPLLARLLKAERTPQAAAAETETFGLGGRHWTRGQAVRHWLFWLSVPMLVGPSAFNTALFFQKVHLAEVKGWELAYFVALFPLFTAVAFAVTLLSGLAIDRYGAAKVLGLYLVPFALGFFLMAEAQTLAAAALAMVVLALGAGLQSTAPPAFLAQVYGTRHIGAIKALGVALMVLGSALGPGLTGLLIDTGRDFPEQMRAIAVFFVISAGLMGWGILRVLPQVARPAPAE